MKKKLNALQASFVLSTLTAFCLGASSASAALLVGNTRGDNVLLFDEQNGQLLGDFIPAFGLFVKRAAKMAAATQTKVYLIRLQSAIRSR
ncbi:hypothetical protein [Microseira wollei]|uniref:Uncharacterized protein n=1 Tax=Microseira wollei NIES-4236 TaxID=2530354 RepID=A0AAV3WIG2_9CYAN|nr:hypothetical protein [Microseira wollei]GET39249.1 hypothetical protein MiSe_40130 [Microseira wollei NIES-4236]